MEWLRSPRPSACEYGVPVLSSYGATEFTGGVVGWSLETWRRWGEVKRGSVGLPYPGTAVRILEPETREPRGEGELGLIAIRTPQANAGRHGEFVVTNDLGRLDADGFLWVEGRVDDVIVRGGFKVAATEVATVLEQHPQVADAAVIGVPDDRLGHVPVAVVALRGGDSWTPRDGIEGDLKAWVRERMTAYSVPVRVLSAPFIPRNAGMKVMRKDLERLVHEILDTEKLASSARRRTALQQPAALPRPRQ